ncbi:MAG: protein-disulfide reductase DsbD [Azoarcus sp.]|jgi:thiol:disulfide interchange protein DsbD|nr:protein-disulfide reductase DsbD [Azoarcus sp.]
MPIFRRPPAFFFMCLLALCAPFSQADEPLPVEKAFAMSARAVSHDAVEILFEIAPNYYLYGERFAFEASPGGIALGPIDRPPCPRKDDPVFGKVEACHGLLRMRLSVSAPPKNRRFTLSVKSQGCWEGGICYPPTVQRAEIALPAAAESAVPMSVEDGGAGGSAQSGDESGRLAGLLSSASVPLALVSFFGLGLLLAFTPCVFPMIPILSGIIVGTGTPSSRPRALALSIAYVLGMALVYALAGVAAGLTGSLLSAALQSTWVPLVFASLFVVLALSMFGFFELRLPAALQNRLASAANQKKGGHLGGVAFMGALSALIVSPCVTAPLAGALLYIAKTGDAVLGGLALFTLALGMGVPLIIVALAAHSLLPKAGAWMEGIRKAGGVLLLAAAAWIAYPALSGLTDTTSTALSGFGEIHSGAELDAQLAAASRPVLLDFYADWCAACKEMERDTFSDPQVAAQMERLQLLRVDVTDYDDSHKALLQRFGFVGPPGIVFFGADGKQRKDLRVAGFMPAAPFSALLKRALEPL